MPFTPRAPARTAGPASTPTSTPTSIPAPGPSPAPTSIPVPVPGPVPAPGGSGPAAPLTVLHVAQPTGGGVARAVTDLLRAQCADGLRAVLLCPPDGPLGEDARRAGAEVHPWPADREPGRRLPRETASLARAAHRIRPDLVHLHSAKAGLAGRLALRGRVPTLFQPHAWSFEAVGGPVAALATRWERLAARWAHRVVCVSEDERLRGARAGVRGRWAVLPNGVDTGRFRPPDAEARDRIRAELRARHGIAPRAPLVVCVGRLCRQKAQDTLLAAWPAVTARVPGARLVLVGDGPDSAVLRSAAPSGVLFPGPTADPAWWYAAADLVALPSRWEGMALVPLEAMACGCPVVVGDVGGARESLPPGHADDCLVPPADPGALARTLAALLARPDRRRDLGREAVRHVRAHHAVRHTAAAFPPLYRELLAERRTGATVSGAPAPVPSPEPAQPSDVREATPR